MGERPTRRPSTSQPAHRRLQPVVRWPIAFGPVPRWCWRASPASSLRIDTLKIPPGAPSCHVFQKQPRRCNTAARRRLGGSTFAHLSRRPRSSPTLTAFQPKSSKLGVIEGDLGANTIVINRGRHSRHLTLRLSCGARTQPPSRRRPPARRQLQPVVRKHLRSARLTAPPHCTCHQSLCRHFIAASQAGPHLHK